MMRARQRSSLRWASLLMPLLLLAGNLGQASPGAAAGPGSRLIEAVTPLAGRFLVASPQMVDPNFSETVIYMVEHSERGAMGLVINRPLGLAPLGRLLEKLDGQAVASDQEIRIYAGGPVEPGRGFVLHSSDGAPDGGGPDGADLAVTGNLRVLRALADGEGPAQAIFLFGYAGWGPGQLEAEIAQGAWDIIAPDAALVFDEPDDSRWKRALARHGVEL